MDCLDFVEDNIVEHISRSNTPLGIKPILRLNDHTESIPSLPDISQMDDFGRESLGIINLDGLDTGRESLWIANIKPTDFFGVNLPEVNLATLPQQNSVCDMLNTAFIRPMKHSVRPSLSSCDSISPSISVLNITSRINNSYPQSDFMDKLDFGAPIQLNEKLIAPSLNQFDSLSTMLEDIISVQSEDKESYLKTEKVKSSSFFMTESNEGFNDSIFIEANHLAARFEDGSIYDLDVCENDMLDSIQEPKDLVNCDTDSGEPVIHEKETIFKMVDKMLPSLDQGLPLAVSFKEKCDISLNSILKGKDPKHILSTLSEMLNNDSLISESKKSEGQNMISNLAAILMSNVYVKQNHLDDSGHSSIENEVILTSPENQCYEILDLRKKKSEMCCDTTDSVEVCAPLDLSLRSKLSQSELNETPKILPPKYKNILPHSLIKSNNVDGGYFKSANDNRTLSDNRSKFKLKKTEESSTFKKGPMRAVVPLDNMAKRRSGNSKLHITPKRGELQSDTKVTSTAINGVLKPVAQSTPQGTPSITSLKKTNSTLTSFSGKIVKPALSYSRSSFHSINKTQDLKNKKAPFIRRHSVDNIQKAVADEKVLSKNIRGSSGIASLTNNIHKTSTAKHNSRPNRSLPVLKENRSKSVTRSSFGRRSGKENMC